MEKLQKAKEQAHHIDAANDINRAELKLPPLTITDEDKDAYLKCIVNGVPFQRKFESDTLGMTVVFRDKTKKETDIISRQIDKSYNDGNIYSLVEYTNLFNMGCLYYQLEEINGVKQNREYPESAWNMKDFNLMSSIDRSPIGSMSSSVLFMLMAMMSQFNQQLYNLAMMAIDPNFTNPAKGS